MAGKLNASIRILAVVMVVLICFAGERARSDTIKMNIFERFRNEMTISHDAAAAKFMNPNTLANWNATIMPFFDRSDRQLSHFFAFSMIVPKMHEADLYIIFFNPWVDGALLTQWKKVNETWKMENFYFASGERVRGEISSQSAVSQTSITPLWLQQRGILLRNIYSYYKDMRTRLMRKDIGEYMSWFLLSDVDRATDLLRVKLRMRARLELAVSYVVKDKIGPILSSAFSAMKYDALTGNKKKLATYSIHADILVDLRPEIIKTFRENWFFKKGNIYSVILSSPVAPRLFLFMSIISNGKIESVLLGDLESMATMLQRTASTMQSTRKVQRYRDADGNLVEIISENSDGKVTLTTRVNGKVTEVLTF